MKIYLSNYRYHWISPFKIAEKLCFWREIEYHEPWVERLNNILYPVMSILQKVLDTIHPRVEYVHIDKYDTWDMNTSLAKIILPMLKQLKEAKNGYPSNLTEKKWDSILDEMIWSFEQLLDDNSDEKFWTDGIDWDGLRAHNAKIDKGLALFGKYYRNMWD